MTISTSVGGVSTKRASLLEVVARAERRIALVRWFGLSVQGPDFCWLQPACNCAGAPVAIERILYGNFKKAPLHIFTDASAHEYACCSFLRCEDEGEVKVALISAKARVASAQKPTILRLELLGAAIGSRIASTILEALDLPLKTYFWTDSMIVLGWITNTEPWNTFVGNRVKEIRELTNVEDWRFVPGDVNPADLPSRSCKWFEPLQIKWWEGPKWLYEPPEFWPYTEITLPEEAMKERRKLILGEDPEDFVRPTFLPDHPIVRRLIDYIHQKLQHAGVQTTLSHLREPFLDSSGSEDCQRSFTKVSHVQEIYIKAYGTRRSRSTSC
ncbi:reverse transcriptase [Caerostris darwini]|uniref:Reverse transcriptase n=1 Tax=Caerostris darwini TaxID=1538125 RepID=A0AAV4N5S2_9ARAC|nr:reverse transcriptase [Caerostris darwini]